MRNRRASKRKIVLTAVAAAAGILLFWFVLNLITGRVDISEQFGDSGGWGDEDEATILMFENADYETSDNIDTFLVAGTDAGGEDVDSSHRGTLADFLALLIIDNSTKKYGIIQIDRNTMVSMAELAGNDEDGEGVKQQICLSHWYGENEAQRNDNMVNAVSELFGQLDIDNYYVVNMEDFGRVNNALGGVEVEIETDMTDVDQDFVKGTSVVLTDEQAEKFIRARMGVGEGTNKERMSRQTQYMNKAYSMVMDQMRENPEYLNDLYALLDDVVEREEKGSNISQMTNHMMQYENMGILQIDGTTKVGDTQGDGIDHEEFYADQASIVEALSRVIDLKESAE